MHATGAATTLGGCERRFCSRHCARRVDPRPRQLASLSQNPAADNLSVARNNAVSADGRLKRPLKACAMLRQVITPWRAARPHRFPPRCRQLGWRRARPLRGRGDRRAGAVCGSILCDCALERARLALARGEAFAPLNGLVEPSPPPPALPDAGEATRLLTEARKELDAARKFIAECGYHRRDEELAELDDVVAGRRRFAELPPRV